MADAAGCKCSSLACSSLASESELSESEQAEVDMKDAPEAVREADAKLKPA